MSDIRNPKFEIDEERFENDNVYRYMNSIPPPKCLNCGEWFITGAGMRKHLLTTGRMGHVIRRDYAELWVGEDGDIAVYRFDEYHMVNGKVNK